MTDNTEQRAAVRDALCRLIEDKCPRIDPDTDIAIGTQVEALADAILAAQPAPEQFPADIGRLHLGDSLSDGERLCDGCNKEIPLGHVMYWPERMGEYPDDVDPKCIGCAIDQTESDQGWCEVCTAREAAAPLPTDPVACAEGVGEYIERRLSEGGLRLVSGSPTMLADEFARFESERLAALSPSSPVEGGEK
jgi:hypothetical protein